MTTVADLTVGEPGVPRVEDLGDAGDELAGDELHVDDVAPLVTEDVVRGVLEGAGATVGNFVGDVDVPEHWHFTDDELAALVPPLTRVVNRTPRLRAAVAKGEGLLVLLNMAGYVGRNLEDGRQAKKERRGDIERETGRAAGPTGHAAAGGVVNGSGADRGGHRAPEGGSVH